MKCMNCGKEGTGLMTTQSGDQFCDQNCQADFKTWKKEFFAKQRALVLKAEKEKAEAERLKKIEDEKVAEKKATVFEKAKSYLPGGSK